ncbi:hypothetical protein LA345_40370 (plasmid) [Burkholderia vietnamiensis]|uniref:Uncharacterized protein n=1 Tax=Burkholderia vietnamiensis (strain G4 / LMG 22486) TaxID=269482 RepID=A4JU37_BURVG|nr:hypothetical protein Bcep1808_6903 [Burkholderia vietnamiensis G4]MCB4350050.1 hypothetical protein [Burkholderia vietnamiensis]
MAEKYTVRLQRRNSQAKATFEHLVQRDDASAIVYAKHWLADPHGWDTVEVFNETAGRMIATLTDVGAAAEGASSVTRIGEWSVSRYGGGWCIAEPDGRVHVAHDSPSSVETERALARLCALIVGDAATSDADPYSDMRLCLIIKEARRAGSYKEAFARLRRDIVPKLVARPAGASKEGEH